MTVREDSKEIHASVILDKIKEGLAVDCDGKEILGILDISQLDLKKRHVFRFSDELEISGLKEDLTVITSPIKITNSELKGIIGFDNAIFEHGVNFNGSKFDEEADFTGSQFIGTADFNGSQFNGSPSFRGAKLKIKDQTVQAQKILDTIEIGLGVCCDNVIIEGEMDLNRLKRVERKKGAIFGYFSFQHFYGRCNDGLKVINSWLEFKNTIFLERLDFSCCQFKKDIDFWICTLKKDANFERSLFCGNAQLCRVNFQKYSIFSGSQFCKDAEFSGSIFSLGPKFDYVGFRSNSVFDRSEFKDDANFNVASFNKQISFEYAKINAMGFDAKFNQDSTITLRESEFRNLKIPWNLIKDRLVYSSTISSSEMLIDDHAYLNLIKNYNEMGWFNDSDSCYVSLKKLLMKKDIDLLRRSYRKIRRISEYNVSFSKKVYIFIKEIYNAIDILIRLIFYCISFAFYGHGVRLIIPVIFGACVIVGSAVLYTYGCQASSFWPRGFIISAKAFIGIAQLQSESLTGLCEYWSIIERFIGSILMVTFTLVLAKKLLR